MVMPTAGEHSLSQGCGNFHLHGIWGVEKPLGKVGLWLNSPGARCGCSIQPPQCPKRGNIEPSSASAAGKGDYSRLLE